VRAAILVLFGACSFAHGSLAPRGGDGSLDGRDPGDGLHDTTPPQATCLERWIAGPTFTTPQPLSVNTTSSEADPFLTADELTIYFVTGGDIYQATRSSPSDEFANRAKANDLSSTAGDSKVSLTADGLTAFLNSSRTGGSGGSDVWRGTRASVGDAFTVDNMYLASVNTSGDQWDPHTSADGLRLYLAPSASPMQTIAVASRSSPSAAFGTAMVIDELNSQEKDNDPTLTADERLIVFASNRGGNRDLWYALRANASATFGAPQAVPMLNTNTEDGPHISSDGCRLYFVSDRNGNADLFVASVQ
jgi:Tol biopolymer transport system component